MQPTDLHNIRYATMLGSELTRSVDGIGSVTSESWKVCQFKSILLCKFRPIRLEYNYKIFVGMNFASTAWGNAARLRDILARFGLKHSRSLHGREHIQQKRKRNFNELTAGDMETFFPDIRKILHSDVSILREMCHYYFDSTGKSFRPKMVFLTARACNVTTDNNRSSYVLDKQRKVAMIAEMIHTGSLIHDDVVDVSNTRRGKNTVNKVWGDRNAVLAGNYVLSRASHIMASIEETQVVIYIARIIDDLVRGEFMQINPNTNFDHYLKKTYQKTASLIANSCKSAAFLSGCSENTVEAMYHYGRNVGMAFQLVDDVLDFCQSAEDLGKPAVADLKLGLATAPVLFACDKHPFLQDLIMRRFKKPGDVERALEAVRDSDGLESARILARQYSADAKTHLESLVDSEEKEALSSIADAVIDRSK